MLLPRPTIAATPSARAVQREPATEAPSKREALRGMDFEDQEAALAAGGDGPGAGANGAAQKGAVAEQAQSAGPGAGASASGKPDLAVTSVKVDRPIARIFAEHLTFTATVKNQGDVDASKVPLWARLSPTPTPDKSKDQMPQDWIGLWNAPLAPGKERTYALDKLVPAGTKGKWWPGVTVDPGGIVADGDRTNNTGYAAEQVTITDQYGNGATDERLGYTPEAHEAAGRIDAERLPYHGKSGTWDSREILSKWTQVDGYAAAQGLDATTTDEYRCGPTSAIAAQILGGPQAVYRFAWNLSDAGMKKYDEANQGDMSKPGAADRARELGIANAMCIEALSVVDPEMGTYGHLSKLAHAAKVIMTTGADRVTDGKEMVGIMQLGGGAQTIGQMVTDRSTLDAYIGDLALGQKYMVNVDTDVRPADRTDHMPSDCNHWVMIAAVGTHKDNPRIVLYDPYPRAGGRQYSDKDEPGFWKYFQNDDAQGGAFRGCIIATKSGAGVQVT